ALAEIVIVALELEVADNGLRTLIAPVGQQHDVIVIEALDVAGLRFDDDRAVNTGLFLKPGMAVIPVGAALMDGEAVQIGLPRRDTGKTQARYAIHRRGRADAVPMDRARLRQAVGHRKRYRIALAPAQDRRR